MQLYHNFSCFSYSIYLSLLRVVLKLVRWEMFWVHLFMFAAISNATYIFGGRTNFCIIWLHTFSIHLDSIHRVQTVQIRLGFVHIHIPVEHNVHARILYVSNSPFDCVYTDFLFAHSIPTIKSIARYVIDSTCTYMLFLWAIEFSSLFFSFIHCNHFRKIGQARNSVWAIETGPTMRFYMLWGVEIRIIWILFFDLYSIINSHKHMNKIHIHHFILYTLLHSLKSIYIK